MGTNVIYNERLGFDKPVAVQYFYDQTVALQTYQYALSAGTATLPMKETIFSNVIDNPGSAYYLYRVDLLFRVINDTGACEVTTSKLGNRNISVQVVKS